MQYTEPLLTSADYQGQITHFIEMCYNDFVFRDGNITKICCGGFRETKDGTCES